MCAARDFFSVIHREKRHLWPVPFSKRWSTLERLAKLLREARQTPKCVAEKVFDFCVQTLFFERIIRQRLAWMTWTRLSTLRLGHTKRTTMKFSGTGVRSKRNSVSR